MWFRSMYSCLAEAIGCLKYELGQRLLILEPNSTFKWPYELFPAAWSVLEYPLANTGRLALHGVWQGFAALLLRSPVMLLCGCNKEALHVLSCKRLLPDTIAPFYLNTS